MKMKLSLIALALIATVGIASAQTTPAKAVSAEKEKSCCPEAKQKVTADKKDAKTCKCEGVKEVNGKVVQNKECTGTCEKEKAGAKTAAAGCCEKGKAVAGEKKDQKCEAASGAKAKECAGTCAEQKVTAKTPAAACCEKEKAAVTTPAKVVKK